MNDLVTLEEHIASLRLPDELDREWLHDNLFVTLSIDSDGELADLCEDIVVASTSDGDTFHMRAGGWRIDAAGSVTRTLLASAVIGAALWISGADDIPIELYPAVLPLVVDVRRVKLSTRERTMLLPLRIAATGIEGIAVNPQTLYGRLDPSVRADLNLGDFVDLCDRLIAAGHLDDGGGGDVVARSGGEPAWIRVSWR